MTSILRPRTPPFALTSSTAVPPACRSGPVNGAQMPLNELISPILIGACCAVAGAAVARTTTVASTPRTRCRLIASLPVVRLNVGPKHGEVKRGAPCRSRARFATAVVDSPHDEARARRRRPRRAAGRSSTRRVLAPRARRRPHGQGPRGGDARLPPAVRPRPRQGHVERRLLRRGLGVPGRRHRRAERRQAVRRARRQDRGGLGARTRARPRRRRARPRARGGAPHRPRAARRRAGAPRSEEHTSELQSPCNLVCRLLLEKKKKKDIAVNSLSRKWLHGEQHMTP